MGRMGIDGRLGVALGLCIRSRFVILDGLSTGLRILGRCTL